MGGPLPKENDRVRQDCSCQLHENEATQGRRDGERGNCLHSGRERASSALGSSGEGLFWVHDPHMPVQLTKSLVTRIWWTCTSRRASDTN